MQAAAAGAHSGGQDPPRRLEVVQGRCHLRRIRHQGGLGIGKDVLGHLAGVAKASNGSRHHGTVR
jgi:hypothetical protein